MESKLIKVSVRNLVEFLLREGDIDNRVKSSKRALEGIKGHKKMQSLYSKEDKAEVKLKEDIPFDNFILRIEGRADGVLKNNGEIVIDEIKTTLKDVMDISYDFNKLHWAQAKVYAYIYSKQNNLEKIKVQLTYYNVEDFRTKFLVKEYEFSHLKDFFYDLIEKYKKWIVLQNNWLKIRDKSIQNLKFPFKSYRKGQRDLAIRVYKSILEGKKCFSEAPTGIGKTISTLFPSIKALGEHKTNKIFYITAKTITREAANNTLSILRKNGLRIRSVNITAKDKICKMEEKNCVPEYCPYAKGYFNRLNEALKEALQKEEYNLSFIDSLCNKYEICPFEFSLELSNFCDVIICDYNYIFDPKASLKGILENSKEATLLIDEAHNLLDRGRNMYSSSLFKEDFLKLKKNFKNKDKGVYTYLDQINKYFLEKKRILESLDINSLIEKEEPNCFYGILRGFLEKVDTYFNNSNEVFKELLDLYFSVYDFLNISTFYDDDFITFYNIEGKNLELSIRVLDPSRMLKDTMDKFKSIIIFSATLIPINYFKELYGGSKEDYYISLSSPFNPKNKLTLIGKDISTNYSHRKKTLPKIVDYIIEFTKGKTGNYLVFFPSYKYMTMAYYEIVKREIDFTLSYQEENMLEEEKNKFLSFFKGGKNKSHVGLAVLGGHFSEGIDLTLDKLIGVIIVGVGMPKICLDRENLKEYYNSIGKNGFDYAYVYPGIIKVLQGAGRCIRTEEDRGIVLLLDNRYFTDKYKKLLPRDWFSNILVKGEREIGKVCEEFWNEIKN